MSADLFSGISEIEFNHIKNKLRSVAITLGGKVFHTLFSGSDESLAATSHAYLQKTYTGVLVADSESAQEMYDFKKMGKGVIISNHESGILADYLPLFFLLGDEVLKNTSFYTAKFNLSMNRNQFPAYMFRQATLESRQDATVIEKNIIADCQKIQHEGGYIFQIPQGVNIDPNAPFGAVFQKVIKNLPNDMPILVNNVTHTSPVSYVEILKAIGKNAIGLEEKKQTIVASKLQTVGDWKNMNGKILSGAEMRSYYNSIFDSPKS